MRVRLTKEANPLSGKITFFQHIQPSLESGNYTITVTQTIASTDGKIDQAPYQSSRKFTVGGDRFSLNPDLVAAVFPPESGQGEYSNVLPHIVLTRPTLPWERGPGKAQLPGGDRKEKVAPDIAPWLALLLFTQDDPAPAIQNLTLLDLLSSKVKTADGRPGKLPVGTLFPPFPGNDHNELDYGSSWDDPCTVIDVPLALFNRVAPGLDDLKWLAHVRQTQVNGQSETHIRKIRTYASAGLRTDSDDEATLAVVVGNRLGMPGKQNMLFLVSLENYGPYLPDSSGKQSSNIPAAPKDPNAITQVRLVVLKNWGFGAAAEGQTFAGFLLGLNKPDGVFTLDTLQVQANSSPPPPPDPGQAVANALAMGYTALNHHTRQGDKTVSWMRGPFTPFDAGGDIDIPVVCADQAVQYNPDTGMFDVSYAAAWQLGRLMALQNKGFAEALYNWKQLNTRQTIAAFEEAIIKETLKDIHDPEKPLNTAVLVNEAIKKVLEQFLSLQAGEKGVVK